MMPNGPGTTWPADYVWLACRTDPAAPKHKGITILIVDTRDPAGAAEGEASEEFLLTRCLSIAGGTTQILLNQVAERVLGLPK